jgi:hypothetical protein
MEEGLIMGLALLDPHDQGTWWRRQGWFRGRRGLALIVALALGSLALSSYGLSTWSQRTSGGGGIANENPPAAAAGHRTLKDSVFANLKPFTGPAVTTYGQAAVRAAYKEMVAFTFDTGWNTDLIGRSASSLSRADFADARSYMTPACAKAFDATFAKVVQGDSAAIKEMQGSTFFGIVGKNGSTPLPGNQAVTDRAFNQGRVTLTKSKGRDRLLMTFTAKANLQLRDSADGRVIVATSRIVQYWLVENHGAHASTRPFLIDSWKHRVTTSLPIRSTP